MRTIKKLFKKPKKKRFSGGQGTQWSAFLGDTPPREELVEKIMNTIEKGKRTSQKSY